MDAYAMNENVVYVFGHGTRAYMVVSEFDGCYVLRPLSGGMDWTHEIKNTTTDRSIASLVKGW